MAERPSVAWLRSGGVLAADSQVFDPGALGVRRPWYGELTLVQLSGLREQGENQVAAARNACKG